jgi:hypothetical protein
MLNDGHSRAHTRAATSALRIQHFSHGAVHGVAGGVEERA